MNDHERYFFDVNGYIIARGILSPEQVAALNEAIDNNQDRVRLRAGDQLLSRQSSRLAGSHGRGDIGGILRWPQPWCQPFRDLLTHPPALRYMLELIGNGFRYANANGISMTAGAEGCVLHGGDVMRPNTHLYRYRNGGFWNSLMGVCYQLSDIGPGDGGFVCIPGTHKSNLDPPDDVVTMEYDDDCYVQPVLKAGDALIFTEALTHGTMPWTASHERRTLLYRYSTGGWSSSKGTVRVEEYAPFYDELTPLAQALMEPPYYPGRPDIAALLEEELSASEDDTRAAG